MLFEVTTKPNYFVIEINQFLIFDEQGRSLSYDIIENPFYFCRKATDLSVPLVPIECAL